MKAAASFQWARPVAHAGIEALIIGIHAEKNIYIRQDKTADLKYIIYIKKKPRQDSAGDRELVSLLAPKVKNCLLINFSCLPLRKSR